MQAHAQAMVLASFAADSFALGTHWIYDTTTIDQQFGRITTLLAPHEGTYHPTKKLGDFTHYGDQSLNLLEYLAAHNGHFKRDEYARSWQSFMAEYQGYKDHATLESLKNLAADMDPARCGSHSPILAALHSSPRSSSVIREELDAMLEAVKAMTSLTHCGPGVVGGALFIARSCYRLVHGASQRRAITEALKESTESPELDHRLQQCLEPAENNTRQRVKDFGQMCAIKAALPGAVYTVLKNEDNLEKALIETVMAGGDSAARGMVVGMLFGAFHGQGKNSIALA